MKKIIKKILAYTTTSCILTSSYNVKTSSNDTIEKKQITTTQEDTTNYKIAAHRGFSSKEIENTKKTISLASKKKLYWLYRNRCKTNKRQWNNIIS